MTAPLHQPDVSCTCESQGEDRCDYRWLADEVISLLNPVDDDVAEVGILMDAVREIAGYVQGLPCTCAPDAGPPDWDVQPCGRCAALGRARDKVVER